jgi:hypothetical protein
MRGELVGIETLSFPGLAIPLHPKGVLAPPSAMPPEERLFVICLTYKIIVC